MQYFCKKNHNLTKAQFKVFEGQLPSEMLETKINENTLKKKEFQQILLDSIILHFVVDFDQKQVLDLAKKNSVETLLPVGNDNYTLDKQRLIVLDDFSQFLAIKFS